MSFSRCVYVRNRFFWLTERGWSFFRHWSCSWICFGTNMFAGFLIWGKNERLVPAAGEARVLKWDCYKYSDHMLLHRSSFWPSRSLFHNPREERLTSPKNVPAGGYANQRRSLVYVEFTLLQNKGEMITFGSLIPVTSGLVSSESRWAVRFAVYDVTHIRANIAKNTAMARALKLRGRESTNWLSKQTPQQYHILSLRSKPLWFLARKDLWWP